MALGAGTKVLGFFSVVVVGGLMMLSSHMLFPRVPAQEVETVVGNCGQKAMKYGTVRVPVESSLVEDEAVAMNTVGPQKLNISAPRPHIVVLLVDDLGYSTSFTGNEFHAKLSPTTRKLALEEGVVLTHLYAHTHCSPSRRSFLSGRLAAHSTASLSDVPHDHLDLRQSWVSDKLSAAGYSCHMVGKLHTGARSMQHLPTAHGFESYAGFLHGMDSYESGRRWENGHPAHRLSDYEDPLLECKDDACTYQYSTHYFAKLAARAITRHGSLQREQKKERMEKMARKRRRMGGVERKEMEEVEEKNKERRKESGAWRGWRRTEALEERPKPLFLFVSFQAAHSPWNAAPGAPRSYDPYLQMLWALDGAVSTIVGALKKERMWEHTLLLYQSDNGAVQASKHDVNTPLRGAKGSMFEGGFRTAGFVSGGFLPAAVRGTKNDITFHIVDWYTTFCHLAGISAADDARASPSPLRLPKHRDIPPPRADVWGEHAFPAIDGVDIWDMIVHRDKYDIASAHPVLLLDPLALLVGGRFKLVVAQPPYTRKERLEWAGTAPALPAIPVEQVHPCTEKLVDNPPSPFPVNAEGSCLFDIRSDQRETRNLAFTRPNLAQNLTATLHALLRTSRDCNFKNPLFPPSTHGSCSPPHLLGTCLYATVAQKRWEEQYPPAPEEFLTHQLDEPHYPTCDLPKEVMASEG